MRKPKLDKSVSFPQGEYSVASMLREFVWGHPAWCADEATAASLTRCAESLKSGEFDEPDFARVCDVLRQINFPAHVSLELAELRIAFVLTPFVLRPKEKTE